MKIYLIRHGETALKSRGAYQGWIDEPLSEAGKKALVNGNLYGGWVYVSPMKRARQTAAIALPYARQVVVEDLKEMNFGDFEGRTPNEMKTDPAYRGWVDSGCLDRCPNGERKKGFARRTCDAFAGLVDMALKRGDRQLWIVAHGGTQMVVMEEFVDPSRPYYSWLLDCGKGYELDTDRWVAERRLTLRGTVSFVLPDVPEFNDPL